jgi:putative transposase
MVGKRHASDEIAAKLAHAEELAARGKTQREICKALGVSIMTYHRWKKMMPAASGGRSESLGRAKADVRMDFSNPAGSDDVVKQLELENVQLRRLVTDLLLEKLKLEEELRARGGARFREPR